MKLHAKSVAAAVATVALAAGTMILGASAANAAVTPPYEPDAYSLGSLTLYDASGNVVTGGSITTSPIAKYAVASGTTTDAGVNKFAHLSMATPDGTTLTYNYASEALGSDTNYPVSGAGVPAVVSGAGATTPVATGGASDLSVSGYMADFPNTAGGTYAGLYQVRLYTPSTAAQTPSAKYFSVDIQVTGSTWAVVYPAPLTSTAVSTPSPSVASPADHGSSVTLTSTVSAGDSSHPAGTVTWKDGATTLSGGTFNAATGVTSITLSPADGTHSYTAAFAPTLTSQYAGSTSSALSYVVNATGTVSVGLSANPTAGPAFTDTTLTATVSTNPAGGTPGGTMQFFDNLVAIPGSSITHAAGVGNTYVFDQAAGFGTGSHSFTATFTPSNSNAWGSAQTSSAVAATYDAPASTPDQQDFKVTVDAGSLTITTPYTAANPFDLGHMIMSADATHLVASAFFGSQSAAFGSQTLAAPIAAGATSFTVNAPVGTAISVGQQILVNGHPTGAPVFPNNTIVTGVTGNVITVNQAATHTAGIGETVYGYGDGGVTITDTRNGNPNWTASVTSSNFAFGANIINAQNLSFTGVTPVHVDSNALGTAARPVVTNDLASTAGTAANLGGYPASPNGTDGLAGPAKAFAHTTLGGNGTVYVDGTMQLVAPTSTVAGEYHATVTFTIA